MSALRPAAGIRGECHLLREGKSGLPDLAHQWAWHRADESSFALFDLLPYGRKEEWQDYPEGCRSTHLQPLGRIAKTSPALRR